jgi:hypothetical protein
MNISTDRMHSPASRLLRYGLVTVSGTGFSREAFAFAVGFAFDLDLQTHNSQATQIATWVQAERMSRAVGRAAWMRRELPPAMDGGWQRAHGAGPE